MTGETSAKILLAQLPPLYRYISRLQAAIGAITPEGITLKHKTQAKADDLKAYLQDQIDTLEAQREATVSLIKRVPDVEQRLVLELRYGVVYPGVLLSWEAILTHLDYWDVKTIYRRHGTALEFLNRLLEEDSNILTAKHP